MIDNNFDFQFANLCMQSILVKENNAKTYNRPVGTTQLIWWFLSLLNKSWVLCHISLLCLLLIKVLLYFNYVRFSIFLYNARFLWKTQLLAHYHFPIICVLVWGNLHSNDNQSVLLQLVQHFRTNNSFNRNIEIHFAQEFDSLFACLSKSICMWLQIPSIGKWN